MSKEIILGVYLVGCILSYGRWNAEFYYDRFSYKKAIIDLRDILAFFLIALSWAGFVIGILPYVGNYFDHETDSGEFLRFKDYV